MKYKYEIEGNKVIAYCNYAGNRIQASATCMPGDNFDANFGMKLASKRLDLKIWNKRYKRASKRMNEALIKSSIAAAEAEDRTEYFHKVEETLNILEEEYDDFMGEIVE